MEPELLEELVAAAKQAHEVLALRWFVSLDDAADAAGYADAAAAAAGYAGYADAAAGYAADARDAELTMVAEIGLAALVKLGSPGCAFLSLCDAGPQL
jgi:hypothetical protein